MEEFQLKNAVNDECLVTLNSSGYDLVGEKIYDVISAMSSGYPDLDQLKDWIKAIESGKQIVNPETTQEKIKKLYDSIVDEAKDNPQKQH